jgi:hypothetical protein
MDHLRLDNRFTYHAPKPDQIQRYEQIRSSAKILAEMFSRQCPSSPELTLAINAIDQAVMWANASIARNE